MRINTHLLLSLSVVSSMAVSAHNADIQRIEIEKESSFDIYDCDGIGEAGMLLTTKVDDNQKDVDRNHERLTIVKYDTNLKKVGSSDFLFSDKNTYNHLTSGDNLYRFAIERSGEYELLHVKGSTMDGKVYKGTIGKKASKEFVDAIGDYFYVAGELKGLPYVYAQNCKTGESQLTNITLTNKKRFSIMSFDVDENSQEAYLFVKEFEKGTGYIVNFYIFKDGQKIGEYKITPDATDKFPTTAYASKMSDGSYIISGTYDDTDRKTNSISIGVYLKKIENGNVKFSKYINYLDITNFTSYMTKRKQERVEKKKKKKEANNEEYTINYNMLPYRVIEKDGKYLLVGEAYYATYRIVWTTTWVSNGNGGSYPQQMAHSEFDGWDFTHYFVMAFNDNGETEWSNAAPLDMPKVWQLRRHLAVSKDAKGLHIMYPGSNDMTHVSYSESGQETANEKIDFTSEGKKTSRNKELETDFWYGNSFLSHGYQKVKDDDGKRKVYFIDKIIYK